MQGLEIAVISQIESEFKKRGLDVKYEKQIEAWKKNNREKIYSKKMERQVLNEIERFVKDRDNN